MRPYNLQLSRSSLENIAVIMSEGVQDHCTPLCLQYQPAISLQRWFMVVVMSLYKVRPADVPELTAAFKPMGIWPKVANRLPGYVHADLMLRSDSPKVFLLLQYWETAEDFQLARRSEAFRNLVGLLATITTGHMDLGTFGFRSEIRRTRAAGLTHFAER